MSLKKNIIYLHFKGKHLITSKSQYQYNYGQYLYFTDLNLPQAFEVHFSNKERGESETQIGSNKLVEIPDKYFWSGALEIYAWVYLHDETNDGETIYEVRIPLIKRARPTDKEPLPDQQSAIDKAIAELNNALNITNENADKTNADKTQVAAIKEEVVILKEEIDTTASTVNQDAQSANTAAERSEQSAQNSAESERKALDYSDEAKGYAQSALESKDIASQKAQVATDASAEAKDFRDEAETFKNEAGQIKQNVVDYRNETKGYRDEALTAKNDAQDSANAAQRTSEQMSQAGEEIIENVRDVGSRYAAQAETAASNAQTSAESASASATASAQSASEAQSASTNAETYALNSGNKAVESAQSAQASANSATQAQGYANSASASAQGASGYASNAQTSANTASAKAQDASTSAQTASTKASEASQSASQALTYKTDAESAKTASQTAQGLAESARDSAITAKNDAESARDEAQNLVDGISGKVDQIDENTERIESLEDDRYKAFPTDTASGSIASFSDGADDLPLKSLAVDINPIQDLHGQDAPYPAGGGKNLLDPNKAVPSPTGAYGFTMERHGDVFRVYGTCTTSGGGAFAVITGYSNDSLSGKGYVIQAFNVTGGVTINNIYGLRMESERQIAIAITRTEGQYYDFSFNISVSEEAQASYAPYENLCPISGWTEVGVEQRGKNLLDPTYRQNLASNIWLYKANGLLLKANVTYTFSISSLSAQNQFTAIDGTRLAVNYGRNNLTYTPTEDVLAWIDVYFGGNYPVPSGKTTADINAQLELGSTATPYFPYTGRSITIDLGQTVYGGKLDVVSGALTVDMAVVDLGTLNWSYQPPLTGIPHGYFSVENIGYKPTGALICSCYKTVTTGWTIDKVIRNHGSIDKIYVIDSSYTSASDFKTAVTGQQLVYELETPIEIQLTPQQISSLLGVNNIWADSGDTEVEYRADTKLYIERLTAPDSADMIVDSAITSGKFFMVGNSLYRALANIASGATITVGTNAQRVSLSDALNLVNT